MDPESSSFELTLNQQCDDILPPEIMLMILSACDLEAFRAFRLVSKAWAEVGYDILLLPSFVVSPFQADVQRMVKLIDNPRTAPLVRNVVRSLEFLTPDIDMYLLRNMIYNRGALAFDFGWTQRQLSLNEQEALEEANKMASLREAHKDDLTQKRLEYAFHHLATVKHISVTSKNPCKSVHLRKLWEESAILTNNVRFLKVDSNFTKILLAATTTGLSLETFDCDQVQIVGVSQREAGAFGSNPNIFKKLQSFRLSGVDTSARDVSPVPPFQNFAPLLAPAHQLQSLTLRVASVHRWSGELFYKYRWPRLKYLHLDNIKISSTSFLTFIIAHSESLTHLMLGSIYGIDIIDGLDTWIQLLDCLRGTLSLEKFQLAGSIRDMANDGDSCYGPRFYDDEWNPIEVGQFNKASALEKWIVEQRRWPLTPLRSLALEDFVVRGELPRSQNSGLEAFMI